MYKLKKKAILTVLFSLSISFVGFGQFTTKEENDKAVAAKDGKNAQARQGGVSGVITSPLLGRSMNDRNDPLFENIANSKTHVILSEGIAASDLKDELNDVDSDKFTIFAPRDKSFNELPEGKLAELTAAGNEKELDNLIKNHIVKGNYTLAKIVSLMNSNNGRAELKTLSGMKLFILKRGSRYAIVDERGNKSYILLRDFKSMNGVIHDISDVLQEK